MGTRNFPDARRAVEYLEGRIAERRSQERRQKILDDLQLIRNRRNQEVIIPVPPGHDQKMWFEKLERRGIWKKVFEFVTSPSDITSAYFACDMFKKHLEEKRKMISLPKVFGVLRDTGCLRYTNMDPEARRSTLPAHLIPVREREINDNKEVLNLRLVSKMWKKASEEEFLLEPLGLSQPDWHLKCDESYEVFAMSSDKIQCRFRSVEDVDNAMEVLQSSTPSSISISSLIRTITVYDWRCKEKDKPSFYDKLEQFLDIYGHNVWGLGFSGYDDFNYEGICGIVSRMPNLKAMKLCHGRSEDVRFNIDYAKAQFRRKIGQMPFPNIPSLELCTFCGFPPPGDVLLAEIIGRNDHVKTVCLRLWKTKNWNQEDYDDYLISDSLWNALSNLPLEHFNLAFNEFLFPEDNFEDRILEIKGFNCNLKVFHVEYEHDEQLELPYGTLFEILNSFSNSIMEVSGKSYSKFWPLFYDEKKAVTLVEDFPSLRKIDIVKLWEYPDVSDDSSEP